MRTAACSVGALGPGTDYCDSSQVGHGELTLVTPFFSHAVQISMIPPPPGAGAEGGDPPNTGSAACVSPQLPDGIPTQYDTNGNCCVDSFEADGTCDEEGFADTCGSASYPCCPPGTDGQDCGESSRWARGRQPAPAADACACSQAKISTSTTT